MALKIKAKANEKSSPILPNEDLNLQDNKSVLILETSDYNEVDLETINTLKSNIKKSFINFENLLQKMDNKKWFFDTNETFEVILNLELLKQNMSQLHLFTKNQELNLKDIDIFYSEVAQEFEKELPMIFGNFFNYRDNSLFLKEFRNVILHTPEIQMFFDKLNENIQNKSIKPLLFRKIIKELEVDNSFLLKKILDNIKEFKDINKNSSHHEIFKIILELKETLFFYSVQEKRKESKHNELTVFSIDKNKFSKEFINVMHKINGIRNNLVHVILDKSNILKDDIDKNLDFKIDQYIQNLNLDKFKNYVNTMLFEISTIELKNNSKESIQFLSNVVENRLIDVFKLSKEDGKEYQRLEIKINNLNYENAIIEDEKREISLEEIMRNYM